MRRLIPHITMYKHRSTPIMCHAMSPDFMPALITSMKSAVKCPPSPENQRLSVSTTDVRKILFRVNIRKAAGPNNKRGRLLRSCAHRLVYLLLIILTNHLCRSLFSPQVPIVPVPKKPAVFKTIRISDYSDVRISDQQPVALNPNLMKCSNLLLEPTYLQRMPSLFIVHG